MALTAQEAAVEMKCSVATLYKWIKAGKLPYIRMGRAYLFSRKELERLLSGHPPTGGSAA